MPFPDSYRRAVNVCSMNLFLFIIIRLPYTPQLPCTAASKKMYLRRLRFWSPPVLQSGNNQLSYFAGGNGLAFQCRQRIFHIQALVHRFAFEPRIVETKPDVQLLPTFVCGPDSDMDMIAPTCFHLGSDRPVVSFTVNDDGSVCFHLKMWLSSGTKNVY